MPRARKTKANLEVDALRHNDMRVNIPTSELRDFAGDSELTPPTMLYPRDPSLDPQLVWNGKDEQDGSDLEVLAVPIYIQEKVLPQAIVEEVRRQAETTSPQAQLPQQMEMFSDFNGIAFEDLIQFYEHQQHWSNRMILGDSLMVMTSLAEKEGLKGQVQMIYLDPPYGIKFGSNWQVSTRKRDVTDGREEDLVRQPEQVRAFRDTWEKGIHSYLSYLRDRLMIARELLTETGSIFVQIGDENVHLVRCLLDEVFGSENFLSLITFRTTSSLGGDILGKSCDYLIWYAKNSKRVRYHSLYDRKGYEDDKGGRYTRYEVADGNRRVMSSEERIDISLLPPESRIYRHDNLTSQIRTNTGHFPISFEGRKYHLSAGHWKTSETGIQRLQWANRIAAPSANSLSYIRYLDDFPLQAFSNVWTDTQTGAFTDPKVYVVQTNIKVIERCILMSGIL